MMGKFPEHPTKKQLRTLLGFRAFGLTGFSILALWWLWDGDTAGALVLAVLVVVLFAVYVAPRLLQLRRLEVERPDEQETGD